MLLSKGKRIALCSMVLCLSMCSCGSKESINEDAAVIEGEGHVRFIGGDEIIEKASAGEFSNIDQEELDQAIDAEDITKEIFQNMPLDEFRVFVAKNFPNYREIYHIEEDKVMTDDDWQSVKYLMSYQLYGEFIYPEEEGEETTEEEILESIDVEKEIADYFNDESQEESTEEEADLEEAKKIVEELSSMSDDDFYAYVLYSMAENGTDITEITITPEELAEIRKQVIEEYSSKLSE